MTGAGITETTITQSNKTKAANTAAAFINMVEGQYAAGLGDLRIVATVGAYRLWESTIDSAADMVTIAAFMRAAGLSWTVRGSIEDNTANNDYGRVRRAGSWDRKRGRGRNLGGCRIGPRSIQFGGVRNGCAHTVDGVGIQDPAHGQLQAA